MPRPERDEPGFGRHSGEFPQTGGPGRRPAGSSRPVSAVPEGTSFGSRNTGRVSRGVANPESYRGADSRAADSRAADNRGADSRAVDSRAADNRAADNRGTDNRGEPTGRNGAQEPGRRTGPLNPPPPFTGDDTGPRPGNRTPPPGRGGAGRGGTGTARASAAVVPPVVPGLQGARTPAVPGRAGAMADSPSGVIQRPGEGSGAVTGRGSGRVPRPGAGRARPGTVAGTATGRVRPTEPGEISGRVRGVDPDVIASGRVQPIAAAAPDTRVRPATDEDGTPHLDRSGSGPASPARARAGVASVGGPVVSGHAPSGPVAGGGGGAVAGGPVVRASTGPVPAPPPAPVRPFRAPEEFPPLGLEAGAGVPDVLENGAPGEWPARRRRSVITLVSLSVIVLGLLPLLFGVRTAAGHDPVYASIDALDVPGWAAQQVQDRSSGSRWCFLECPLRERTAQSQQGFTPTGKVYAAALTRAGWTQWTVPGCPDQPIDPKDGVYSCWRRDEFTLDLWVRLPECAVDRVALSDPAVLPSAGLPTPAKGKCTGSTVSMKVQNAIADTRGQPDGEKPGLVGETPDPVLTDPLLPTPSPS